MRRVAAGSMTEMTEITKPSASLSGDQAVETPSARVDGPSSARGWYVVAILAFITALSQFDRHLPSLLVDPLKLRFAISDTEFSLLHGYAFAITYAVLGVPLGRLVDYRNRRNLIIAGLVCWSLMTALAAFATTFGQLLVTRMGVGIGEAVLAPAAYSIIADYFSAERRGKAMAIYFTSLVMGGGVAMMAGGAVLRALPAEGIAVPLLGHLELWQAMFLVAGLPGFVAVWLLLTVREPARCETAVDGPRVPFTQFLQFVRQRASVFGRIIGAAGLFTIVGYGVLGWAPALFDRRFGVPPGQSAMFLGLLMIVGGTLGPVFAGWLSDRLHARGTRAGRIWPLIIGAFVLIPATGWAIMPTVPAAILMLAFVVFAIGMINASLPIILQQLAPNEMRGQTIALYMLVVGVVGIGFGPMAVGLLTDYVFRSDALLPWSIVTMAAPAALVGTWLCWRAIGPYQSFRRD